MARKFKLLKGGYVWALEQCEEIRMVALYEQVRGRIHPQSFVTSFDYHFYELGDGVLDRDLEAINMVLRRETLPRILFSETEVSTYNRPAHKVEHREFRREAQRAWQDADKTEKMGIVERAEAQIKLLPPARMTNEEYLAQTKMFANVAQDERHRRRAALLAADAATFEITQPSAVAVPASAVSAKQPSMALSEETALRMLRLPAVLTNDEFRARVIGSISAEQALTLAEQIDDPLVQSALVERVLSA